METNQDTHVTFHGYIIPTAAGRARAKRNYAIIMIAFVASFVAFFAGLGGFFVYAETKSIAVLVASAVTFLIGAMGAMFFNNMGELLEDAALRKLGVRLEDVDKLVSINVDDVTDEQLLEAADIYPRYITARDKRTSLESRAILTDAQKAEVAQLTSQCEALLVELRDALHPAAVTA